MIIYIILFFIPAILYFYYKDNKQASYKPFLFFFISLAVFVGLGDMLGGYDRYIYGDLFDNLADQLKIGTPIILSDIYQIYNTEFGYIGLNWAIAHITSNRYIFIFLYTICMYAIILHSFRKYAKNYPLASILFMALVFYFSFTYLRQMFAAAIIALSIKYIIERKFLKYCAIIVAAFSFHNSAIIFFPMYFIADRKYSKARILLLMSACFIIGVTGITSNLYNLFDDISTRAAHADYAVQGDARIAYILEAGFFLFFLIKSYRNLPNTKQSIVLYNIALAFCAVLLLFIRSDNGGRLSWYFIYGLIFSLTQLSMTKYGKRHRFDLYIMAVSLVLFLRITVEWSFNMCPYKTFLTPGHTAEEWIYERYEYDLKYDMDKFYR
ncbi:EpsG family protein [Prevotella intermedia]|jgi:putative membrane protein|uniref:EpsG family protein n=1 Tax=Prevotella intermedia TaxID=28131 RepID=UPI000C1BEACF|nr:EpsG family protein [Prevotella intermedia]ATV28276.1 EpsG family protein [Prevotella intermedia]